MERSLPGGEGDVCFAGDTIGVGAGLLRDW